MQSSIKLVQTLHLNCLQIHTQPHSLFLLYYVGLVLCFLVVNLVWSLVGFGTFYRFIHLWLCVLLLVLFSLHS